MKFLILAVLLVSSMATVLSAGTELTLNSAILITSAPVSFEGTQSMAAGDTMDFAVGTNGGDSTSYWNDSTGLVLTVDGVSANELYAAAESSNPSNPIGSFTLGYIGASGFVPFMDHTAAFPNWNTDAQGYSRPMSVGGLPLVKVNTLLSPILLVGGLSLSAPHEMWLHPSQENYPAVVRFTAPTSRSYTFSSTFRRLDMNGGNGVVASVTKRSLSTATAVTAGKELTVNSAVVTDSSVRTFGSTGIDGEILTGKHI